MTVTIDPNDLANRRHALSLRIRTDERKLAIAYPEDAKKLKAEIKREKAMLADVDEHLDAAKEMVREQMVDAAEAYFAARSTLVKLTGFGQDPGFTDPIFTRPYLAGSSDPQLAIEVKAALLGAVDLEPVPDPDVPDHQLAHEEKLRNERAGRGYFTDDQLAQEHPEGFWYGAGAKVARRMNEGGA